jgi:hypothetical protein
VNMKQIVAVLGIFALLAIIAYPAFSTGSVSVIVHSLKAQNADHIYVTINDVWAHRAHQTSDQGWELISNQSQTIDLTALTGSNATLGKGTLSVADYDMVKINVSNVTWVYSKNSTQLQVESPVMFANVEFTVTSGKQSSITLVLTGHEEEISGTKFFLSQLNATATLHS